MIDGVCGGVAKYFNIDPTLIRIAWVLLVLLGGSGILLYIVAMIVIPKEPYAMYVPEGSQPIKPASAEPSQKNSLFWGVLLIVIGLLLFLDNMGFPAWHRWWSMDWDVALSVVMILVGVAFLWGGRNSLVRSAVPDQEPAAGPAEGEQPTPSYRKLYRSFTDSKLFGVCGGLAEYFGIDSSILRVLFIVVAFASSGILVLGYITMAIVVPKKSPTFTTS